MADDVLKVERHPNYVTLILNRPEKRNALNAKLIATLHESLARSARDADVKVVVISGAGSDFCLSSCDYAYFSAC